MSIFKRHIEQMGAYKPPLEGRDPNAYLLLDFNERTLPIAEVVQQAVVDYVRSGRLQMYPSYGDIVDVIAGYCQVPPEQLMITNGSDQGIDLIIRSACRAGDEIIIPQPSFALYRQMALVEDLHIIEPDYSYDGGFPTEQVLAAISDKTRVVCIANPNNPSGTVVPREDILRIARAAPQAAILLDECYYEYFGETLVDQVDQVPNLVITRTFSKTWGFPSLRLGYIIAREDNIRALLNVRGPYDINQLAVVAVRAALAHPEYTQAYVKEVMAESKPRLETYLNERGIRFWPSGANFIWVFFDNAREAAQGLQERGILVRPKADRHGQLGVRITLGTMAQTDHLLAALDEVL